ncbi:MAG: phosphate ABC transporter substrate-binding protein [Methanomassiliicoccaceae archaeon]|nr:phosphate ABC transporter substrate-binding protein [Methanomassiliicoccaceae archaeon]
MKMIMAFAVVGMLCLGGGFLVGSSMSDDRSQTLNIAGSSSVGPLMTTYVQEYSKLTDSVKFNLSVTDSTDGVNKVLSGAADIGMSSSKISDAAVAAGAVATEICKDAIVVVVSPKLFDGGVTNLTPAQMKGIYEGTITNWQDVGFNASVPIANTHVFIREEGSGTRDAFESLIGKPTLISGLSTQNSTGLMRSAVSSAEYAIGYISLGSLNTATDKAVSVNGVPPSIANAMNGTYELVRSFYLVTKGAPTGTAALFIDWILSPTGQKHLGSSFVPLYAVP